MRMLRSGQRNWYQPQDFCLDAEFPPTKQNTWGRFRMSRKNLHNPVLFTVTLALLVIAFTGPAAWAQGISPVVWSASRVSFDNGQAPSIAISGWFAVEVHEGASGTLWYSTGQIQDGTILWTVPTQYANGYAPSIAISGSTVIEVHQAVAGEGALWNQTAQIFTTEDGITWDPPTQYDNGLAPSVTADGPTVFEVHQGGSGVGPLYYHTGTLLSGTVEWAANPAQYDTGVAPSVALAGSTVIEVHQAGTSAGPLWCHAAEIRANGSVVWAATTKEAQYGTGLAPSVSASGPTVIEVHQEDSGVGSILYQTAALQSSGAVKFAKKPLAFDIGEAPRVYVAGTLIVEVQDVESGTGSIFYHTGAY
jgi:hypothetical protein